jgi:hypothetical protein
MVGVADIGGLRFNVRSEPEEPGEGSVGLSDFGNNTRKPVFWRLATENEKNFPGAAVMGLDGWV